MEDMRDYERVQNEFIEWVQDELITRGWSQTELARRANVSQATINALLLHKQACGDRTALGIARAFGYTVAEVRYKAGLREEPPMDPPTFQELLSRVADLDPADLPLVMSIIDRLRRK